jgi:uridine kinase
MLIIGIAGGTSGRGKTTVVHQIMNELLKKQRWSYYLSRLLLQRRPHGLSFDERALINFDK